MLDNEPTSKPGKAMRDHWVSIVDAAHDKLAGKIDARKTAHVAGILEQFETDLGPHLVPLLEGLVDNPNVPAPIRELLGAITAPQHFTQSLLIGIAVGAVISPVLAAATSPLVEVLSNEVWDRAPTRELSPDLLAASVLKGVLTEPQAAAEARKNGIDTNRFHTMVMTAGQGLGIGEALLLYRRGDIDRAEFDRIVHYSNVRNDFIPDILKLRYAPPSAGEVIAGALKQHLDAATAKSKLSDAGINPDEFDWMLATAGRPYGTHEALDLLNRGVIDENRVREVIAQSDVNPRFTEDILALRVYLPPPRSVVPLLRNGAITEARARTLLQHHGLSAEDANAFIAEAMHSTSSTAKELTGSQVIRMYSDGFIDRATASTRLTAAKYQPDQIVLMLDFADDQRKDKLTNALIRKIGSLYVAHKIDRSQAATALNGGPVPAKTQADLFHVWDLERSAIVHHPTASQVVAAWRRTDITEAQMLSRLRALGIEQADIPIVISPGIHRLSSAQIVGAYRRTEIGARECKVRLLDIGIDPDDLAIIVADGWPPGKIADAKAAAAAVVAA